MITRNHSSARFGDQVWNYGIVVLGSRCILPTRCQAHRVTDAWDQWAGVGFQLCDLGVSLSLSGLNVIMGRVPMMVTGVSHCIQAPTTASQSLGRDNPKTFQISAKTPTLRGRTTRDMTLSLPILPCPSAPKRPWLTGNLLTPSLGFLLCDEDRAIGHTASRKRTECTQRHKDEELLPNSRPHTGPHWPCLSGLSVPKHS